MAELYHYPYHFFRNFRNEDSSLPDLLLKRLYIFKSPKTNQTYWAWVEEYKEHFYAIKFHLKQHKDSSRKYQLLTGLNEARPVINTCIAIMQEISNVDDKSSFGFIGANMENEGHAATKRYRIYQRIVSTFFGNEVFTHFFFPAKSAYVMMRSSVLEADPDVVDRLNKSFLAMYEYFE